MKFLMIDKQTNMCVYVCAYTALLHWSFHILKIVAPPTGGDNWLLLLFIRPWGIW